MAIPLAGCATAVEPHRPDLAAWRGALASLGELRTSLRPGGPERFTLRLALSLREPRSGRTLDARGAVAIDRGRGLRMILVGPGGSTAMDLWMEEDRWRLAIPAIDLVKRGDRYTPLASRRALPVDFLRWWLLRPAGGALLDFERTPSGLRFWLQPEGEDDVAVEIARGPGGSIRAARHALRGEGGTRTDEVVESDGKPCGRARYVDGSTGLEVEVRCEDVDPSAKPDPAAFVDPDA